ncbi:MAG: peptidylprolyl isomerase [Myxococcota bacterium]
METGKTNVAARINGKEITMKSFERRLNLSLPKMTYHKRVSSERRAKIEKAILDQMIVEELLWQECERLKIRPDDKELATAFEDAKREAGGEKALEEILKRSGASIDEFKETVRRQATIRLLIEKEVNQRCSVTEEKVLKYYEENKINYTMPAQYKLSHILLKVPPYGDKEMWEQEKKRGEELVAALRAGADFATMAKKHSQDEFAKKGGALEWVHQGSLLQEIETALEGMKIGDISEPIKSIYGFHIVKLEGKKPPQQMDYERVKASVTNQLASECKKERNEELTNKLREKAKIEVLYNFGGIP